MTIIYGTLGTIAEITLVEHIPCQIAYHYDGGKGRLGSNTPTVHNPGKDTPIPNAVGSSGYDFVGWYKNADYSGARVTTISKDEDMDGATIDLYGKFEPKKSGGGGGGSSSGSFTPDTNDTWAINYVLDGGTNHPANPTWYKSETGIASFQPATKTGYKFLGWYDRDPNAASTTTIQPEEIRSIAPGSNKPYTLYAKYERLQYPIYYELDGGVNSPDNPSSHPHGTGTGPLKEASKEHYTFDGWYRNTLTPQVATGSAIDFSDASAGWVKVSEITAEDVGETWLYASFVPNRYKIDYQLDGGANSPENPDSYTYGVGVESLMPATKEGYVFDGWYADSAFTTKVTEIAKTAGEDVTLYARFNPEEKVKPEKKKRSFGPLFARSIKTTKTSITYEWNSVKGAKRYKIYGNFCNKGEKEYHYQFITYTKDTTYTAKHLKKKRFYKYYIAAVKKKKGKEIVLCRSRTIHETTKNKKTGSATKLIIKKKEYQKEVGQTVRIKAKEYNPTREIHSHRPVRFESSDSEIATVTKSGKVQFLKEGTCEIYVYAQNGLYETVTIKVLAKKEKHFRFIS